MKIFVYPGDQHGCGYYRLIWASQALQQAGVDVVIVDRADQLNQFQAKMFGDRIVDVIIPDGADVMVFQRPTHKTLTQAIPHIRAKGVAVVIDVDDDLTSIDPRNPAFGLAHPSRNGDHSWQNTRTACEAATLVMVSTPALLDVYARRSEGCVIYNYVPRYFTEYPHVDSTFVGWAGAVFSHPGDLQAMGPALSRIARDFSMFRIIGPEDGLATTVGETVAARMNVVGKVEFLDWYTALSDNLGIGVAPLADTRFNRSKSWLKPLEYASVGVIPVSSARVEYVRLMEEFGIGWVASSPKDWYRLVKQLVTNEGLRRELSSTWRETVRSHLTIEDNAYRWLDAWTRAVQIQRRQPVRAL